MNSAVLARQLEDRPQESKRGEFRPRADGEVIDELLYILAADLVERNVAEARADAELPMLDVAAPRLG